MSAKRATVHIFNQGELVVAMSLARFLKWRGFDAVVVSKHAVQVLPDEHQRAMEATRDYKWGWDRKESKSNETRA